MDKCELRAKHAEGRQLLDKLEVDLFIVDWSLCTWKMLIGWSLDLNSIVFYLVLKLFIVNTSFYIERILFNTFKD